MLARRDNGRKRPGAYQGAVGPRLGAGRRRALVSASFQVLRSAACTSPRRARAGWSVGAWPQGGGDRDREAHTRRRVGATHRRAVERTEPPRWRGAAGGVRSRCLTPSGLEDEGCPGDGIAGGQGHGELGAFLVRPAVVPERCAGPPPSTGPTRCRCRAAPSAAPLDKWSSPLESKSGVRC